MNKNNISYGFLSLAGLFFLVLIFIFSGNYFNPFKFIFLSVFIMICILGILASIYPSYCLRILNIDGNRRSECDDRIIGYEGHHADCGVFKDHVFNFRNKKYCVGCSGLLTGAFLAIFTSLGYVFYGTFYLIFWLGILMVLAALIQLIFFSLENKWIKFLSNLGLVWGSALIFMGLLEYGNIFMAVYFLFLILVWIITRTALSQENHILICEKCLSLKNK